MKTEKYDPKKATALINEIYAALKTRKLYTSGHTSWEIVGNRLDEHDDRTGSWHSVQKGSLDDHVSYVARTVADWSDDAEGEVLTVLATAYRRIDGLRIEPGTYSET